MSEREASAAIKIVAVVIPKIIVLSVIIVCSTTGCTHTSPRQIHVSDLESKRTDVIGCLGFSLGWVVRVEAVIIDGDKTRNKRYLGQYLLSIVSINGKKIEKPLLMEFSDRTHLMPNDHYKRYEEVEGRPTGGLNAEIKKRINMGYVGNMYDLLVFEEGSFSGPRLSMLPENLRMQQGDGYCFETSVCILEVYKRSGQGVVPKNSTNENTRPNSLNKN